MNCRLLLLVLGCLLVSCNSLPTPPKPDTVFTGAIGDMSLAQCPTVLVCKISRCHQYGKTEYEQQQTHWIQVTADILQVKRGDWPTDKLIFSATHTFTPGRGDFGDQSMPFEYQVGHRYELGLVDEGGKPTIVYRKALD